MYIHVCTMYGTEGIFLLLPTGACMYIHVHARTLKSQVLRGPTSIKIYIYFFCCIIHIIPGTSTSTSILIIYI